MMKKYILLILIVAIFVLPVIGFSQFTEPVDVTVCKGDAAYFTVQHSNDYDSFHWMQSDNEGGAFAVINDDEIYSGTSTAVLEVSTGNVTVVANGVWKYFRCQLISNIYGDTLTAVVSLSINIPPVIQFSWSNPCELQPVQFNGSVVSATTGIRSWKWTFGDGDTSVYSDPAHVYALGGPKMVTLVAEDDNGCQSNVVTQTVNVFTFPGTMIIGKDVLCSEESNVGYSLNIDNPDSYYNVDILWNIPKGIPDDPTRQNILVDWSSVEQPLQTEINVTTTYTPDESGSYFCMSKTSKKILLTSYKAPLEGEVIQKPYGSTVFIYKGDEVASFQWGYTSFNEGTPEDHLISADKGGARFYCDFLTLDTNNSYWVETSEDARINCVTRSYLKEIVLPEDQKQTEIELYPVPSYDVIHIQMSNQIPIREISTYNMFMQLTSQLTYADPVESATVFLNDYKSGVYILHVKDNQGNDYFSKFFIDK
jgi:PKD repeat protein